MIVVAIIGILASIAIPNFVKFQCRSKQSEAKMILKNVAAGEEAYRAEYDSYVQGDEAQLKIISVLIAGTIRRYDYGVPTATTTTFTSLATASNAAVTDVYGNANVRRGDDLILAGTPDTWEGDSNGRIESLVNVCE